MFGGNAMLSKLRLSSSVLFTAALITAAAIFVLRRYYSGGTLGPKQYVLIGLAAFIVAWGSEWVFRKKPKKPAAHIVKKKHSKKKRRKKR